jgi:hypothetical protein
MGGAIKSVALGKNANTLVVGGVARLSSNTGVARHLGKVRI